LLAEKVAKGGKSSKSVLKDLGEHPTDGGSVQVLDGRYGPYVKYKRTNATLPKDLKPEEVTIEMAVKLIDEKKSKKKGTRKKA
jgi:DNA topoisomerase-1